MKKNAIIFDHDGTLVDSIEAVVVCTNSVLEKKGYSSISELEIMKGMVYPTAERFGHHTGNDNNFELEEISRDFYQEMNRNGISYLKLYSGIKLMLDALAQKGFSLGMVTNSQGLFVRTAAARLSYAFDFEVILGEENVPRTKPDPSGLLQACAGMGTVPEQCWYIGDGKPDYDAAKAAGMKCGLVSWGAHSRNDLKKLGAEKLFDSPGELMEYFITM